MKIYLSLISYEITFTRETREKSCLCNLHSGPNNRRSSLSAKMDSLKYAADKIMKSPRVVKKKIDSALNKEKLGEDWIHNRENVQNGVTFNVKVLGKKPTTEPKNQHATDSIVEELVQHHQKHCKSEKLQKVSIFVDNKKLLIRDLLTHELEADVPIYRISYCTADPKYPKVFTFIAREKATKKLQTHVFLTNKKAMAEAIALTVAQAFTMAYEEWEEKTNERKQRLDDELNEDAKQLYEGLGTNKSSMKHTNPFKADEKQNDDFKYVTDVLSPKVEEVHVTESPNNSADEDDEFQAFAQSRSEVKLNTGLVRKATFKGNVKDYLAVNNTAADLDRAPSSQDLFSLSKSPNHSPNHDSSTNPFDPIPTQPTILQLSANVSSNQMNSSQPTTMNSHGSSNEAAVGNLIEF